MWSYRAAAVCISLLAVGVYTASATSIIANIPDENITWLSKIDFTAKHGSEYTIALSKTVHDEECYILTPEDQTLRLNGLVNSLIKHYGGSDYVSCRVVIGPIEEDLIGSWNLCGLHTEEGIQYARCQPAAISWEDNKPASTWHTKVEPEYNHVVNLGMTLTPTVWGTGNAQNCHVITPNGEDLVVNIDSGYPDINLVLTSKRELCNIAIGPVHEGLLGDWTIYGTFNSFTSGFNEVRLPLHLYLYDEDNPYNQAYNVTVLDPVNRTVYINSTVEMVVHGYGDTDFCYFETPSGQVYGRENNTSEANVTFVDGGAASSSCRISVGPVTHQMIGFWQVIGKFNRNGLFNEIRLPFQIIQEDPENPLDDTDRTIVELSSEWFVMKMGGTQRVNLSNSAFTTHESCHIRTPNGLQYKLMNGFNLPGIKIIEDSNIACGIIVNVVSEDLVGKWTLISRETVSSQQTERRLPFTIYVEVPVNAMPSTVTIAEGNDLYLRLESPTSLFDTCRLLRSDGSEHPMYRADEEYTSSCGFIVPSVGLDDNGELIITYGSGPVYEATTSVTVTTRGTEVQQNLVLSKDRRINQVIGPEDAVYCKVEDPSGIVVFEGFGRCTIVLDKATLEHIGFWKINFASPGRILTEEQQFYVNVAEAVPNLVTTHVTKEQPMVLLSCSVSSEYEVKACKFRDPTGRLLLPNNGVGEDRYRFHGAGVRVDGELHSHECGLRITNPMTEDLGLWRCAVETEGETLYGFLTVLCQWAMMDPNVAASVQSEPILRAHRTELIAVEGESATMSCSVESAIRYCYFRSRNGSIINVFPGTPSESSEYVGEGFESGECGIRFTSLAVSDSGPWSCHVGFRDSAQPEQRAAITVDVQEAMIWNQTVEDNLLIVEGFVHNGRQLEYCRFVRMDGLGFTEDQLPDGYVSYSSLPTGYCGLHIPNPTILEVHPWTIVARIRGQDVELFRMTRGSFGSFIPGQSSSSTVIWVVLSIILVMGIVLAVLLGPKGNRKWTCCKASSFRKGFRNSFRRSLHKEPLGDNPVGHNTTATAA